MKINYTVELLLPAVTASLGVIGKDIDITVKKDKEAYKRNFKRKSSSI